MLADPNATAGISDDGDDERPAIVSEDEDYEANEHDEALNDPTPEEPAITTLRAALADAEARPALHLLPPCSKRSTA